MEQYCLIDPPDPQAVEAARATVLSAAAGLRPILAEDHRGAWRERREYHPLRADRIRCLNAAVNVMSTMPDEEINLPDGRDYLWRWWLQRDPAKGNVCLDQILNSDDVDNGLHDHPWDHVSWMLIGRYDERFGDVADPEGAIENAALGRVSAGAIIWRRAECRHLLERPDTDTPTVSLVVTGPKRRDWGFWLDGEFIQFHDRTLGEGIRPTRTSHSAPRARHP